MMENYPNMSWLHEGSDIFVWPTSWRNLPYTWRVTVVSVYCIASAVWSYKVVRPLPAGSWRFGAAVPVIAGHILIPFLMSREHDLLTLLVLSFTLTWLSLFKVLQLCANRGPLPKFRSFLPFITIFFLPVLPDDGKSGKLVKDTQPAPTDSARLLRQHVVFFVGDLVVLVACYKILVNDWTLPYLVKEFIIALALYAFLSALMDAVSIPAAAMGVRLAPHFTQPWMSSSFAELWSKRWDITAGITLRNLVCDPILEGDPQFWSLREGGGTFERLHLF
eukprot:jgi/Botrbrau1/9207/Bobra.0028s0004.2